MINRYKDKIIEKIWSGQNRINQFVKIEAELVRYYEKKDLAEKGSFDKILKTRINEKEVIEREKITRHDIIAFLEVLEEKSGISKGLHMGITSSDILDTTTGLQIKETRKYLKKIFDDLLKVIEKRAIETKDLITIGRTHNVIAEPTTIGLKFLNHYVEIKRSIEKFLIGLSDGEVGMISGAVGTYSNTCPELEKEVLKGLHLKRAVGTNQIIQRDIYARIISEAAILATTFDRLATEIRLLSHSEINEVAEPFSKGQKGSSAMPHKKNPIRSERISGLSRLLRGFTIPALEDIVLWHERDISHSSVERIIFPDCFHIIAFLTKELIFITKDIYINKENIEKNLEGSKERFYSGVLLTELLKSGVNRKKSYEMIQPIVFESIKNNILFSKVILKDEFFIKKIGKDRLRKILSLDYFKRYVDDIFNSTLEVEL